LIPVIGAPAESAATELVAQERTIAPWVNRALDILAGAQDGVSLGVPYVAFADAKGEHTVASSVMPFSMSLLPPVVDRALGKNPRRPKDLIAALPIEEDSFGTLCGKAVGFVPKQIMSLVEKLPDPPLIGGAFRHAVEGLIDVVIDDVIGKIFSSGDGIFCQPLTGMLTELLDATSDGSSCDKARKSDDDARSDRQSRADEVERDGGTLTQKEKDQQKSDDDAKPIDCKKGKDGNEDPEGHGEDLQFTAKPSKMWELAGNGNVFMHSWSWVSGQPQLFSWGNEGLALAGQGRAPAVTPSSGANAMAEFYFDCSKTWGDASCGADAAWSPNWTARMRRFRSPGEGLMVIGLDTPTGWLDTLQQSIGDHAGDLATEVLEKLTGIKPRDAVSDWISQKVESIPVIHEISQKINSVVGGLRDSTGINDLLDPRNVTDERRIH
jgi:hypothetical protein